MFMRSFRLLGLAFFFLPPTLLMAMIDAENESPRICSLKPFKNPYAETILKETLKEFGQELSKHPALKEKFQNYTIPQLAGIQNKVSRFLCGSYETDLAKKHAHLALTNQEFDIFMELFKKNLAEFASGELYTEIVERMEGFKDQVVQISSQAAPTNSAPSSF